MALAGHRLPYGMRDIKVATLDNAGVKGALVDLPAAQTLEFTEETSSQVLRGDDSAIAQRVTIDAVSWVLDAGGISFEAAVVMVSGAISSTGTTPAVRKQFRRMGTDSYPDFYLVGQAMSESGGDNHIVFHRAKATQFSGTMQDQEFWVSHAEGNAIATLTAANVGAVWDMVANETAIAVA